MTRDALQSATTVAEVWEVRRSALAAGDDELAEAARRRLATMAPENERAVAPRHARNPVQLRRRLALTITVGAVLAVAAALTLVGIGWGNVAVAGAAIAFVFGVVVTTIANEPNRSHHPDAAAESRMNYVRGEGGGGGA